MSNPGESRELVVPADRMQRLTDTILRRLGAEADGRRVFAEPVSRSDLTVVPVAEVRWLFGVGGGSGKRAQEGGEGGGGGGVVRARPVGYIELSGTESRFVPIIDIGRLAPLWLILGGVVILMVLRRLRR